MRLCYLGDVNIQVRLVSEHFRDRGHEVHICTFRPAPLEGIQVHSLLTSPLRTKMQYLAAIPRLRQFLRGICPDVVHAFYATSYGFLGSVLAAERLVISPMGTDVLIGARESLWLRWTIRYALRRCRAIHSVAPHLTEAVLRLGIPAANIRTFPRGVDLERFRRAEVVECDQEPNVVCLRKLEPLYNHKALLEAAPRILASNPLVKFIVCGDGYLKERLVRDSERLGVAAAFRFLGEVSHKELPALLRRASVYFSGALSDGTSVSLLEAMASGSYPVVADIPANRSWIRNGENGSLFPPEKSDLLAQVILEALADANRRHEAARINRHIVGERASWADGIRRIEAIYRAVIDGGPIP